VGLGPGGYNLSLGYGDAPRGMYPHNIVLEFAAEYGLLGLAAFLFLCGLALRNAVSALRRGTDRAGLVTGALGFAVLVYCLANAIVSGDINDNRLLFTAIGLCAALAGPGAQPQVRDPQSPATP
jgi:O-antigen ligase